MYAMASSESFFFGACFISELGGITKHLMTGPSGNSEFCFPSTSMFHIEGLGETKLTVSRGASHQVLNAQWKVRQWLVVVSLLFGVGETNCLQGGN